MRSSRSVSPPLARPRGSAVEPAARRPGAPRASHRAEASSGPRVYRPGEYPAHRREHSRGRIHARYVPYFKIMVLGFLALTVAGGLALALPFASADHARTSLIDAFFTAASAASGTGLVVRDTHDAWSRSGQMTILVLVQVGG